MRSFFPTSSVDEAETVLLVSTFHENTCASKKGEEKNEVCVGSNSNYSGAIGIK